MDSSRDEICIYGASGFTGKFAALSYAKLNGLSEDRPLVIAGRNEEKLEKVRSFIATQLGLENDAPQVVQGLKIVIADANNIASLNAMAKNVKLVVSCVGPYRLFGEPVVKACVENGTHYVDICGEPEFMEKMELKYDAKAREAGVMIVSACGFDAIPAELAIEFARDQLGDSSEITPIAIESYLTISGLTKGCGNYATYESAILGFESASKGGLASVRKALSAQRKVKKAKFNARIPKLRFKNSSSGTYEPLVDAHVFPLPTCDASVVKRTQIQLEELRQNGPEAQGTSLPHPVQFALYGVMTKGYRNAIVRHGAMVKFFSRWSWGRKLLLNNPSFFSGGMVAQRNVTPSDEARAKTKIAIDAYATGIETKVLESLVEGAKVEPSRRAHVRITASDPGYAATGDIAVVCAKTILEDSMKPSPLRLPSGVVTPASVLRGTNIIERLQQVGVGFEVISKE